MIRKDRLIQLAKDLIAIDSQNPVTDEARIAAFVGDFLRAFRISVRMRAYKKRRMNVLAYMGDRASGRSLLITPHLDTVPAGTSWTMDPFAGIIRGGKLYGLGATDCKGNLACAMEVMASIAEEGFRLPYELIFAATADEESGSDLGLVPLLKDKTLRPDCALVLDSDDYSIVVAQKGLLHVKVVIKGRKAHGAYPWRGVNAIDLAVAVLQDVKKMRFAYGKNPFLREPTVNIGTIRGGDKVNVVSDWCVFELDFRFLPGMSADAITGDLKKLVRRHAKRFTIEVEGVQQPYTIDTGHPLVAHLKKAMKKAGVRPRVCGSEGATVITFFQHLNIPAVATGFGTAGCEHKADEYVIVDNLYKGSQALEEFLKRFSF